MTFDHMGFGLPIEGTPEERDLAIKDYIAAHRDSFPEWYMPLQLGEHTILARTYPDFDDSPKSLLDDTSGKRKWDLTLSKVMPDLQGKTVCDIGCNIGIFSMEMARLGALAVDGFDRGPNIVQPNNHDLGTQSVARQAYMVRNIYEAFYSQRFPGVHFHEQDLMTMEFVCEHVYDVFVGCCVLYHLGAERMEQIIKDISAHTPEVILQANRYHGGELGKLSSLAHHVQLLIKYGYEIQKTVMGPPGYPHPVVYATKEI